MRYFMMREMTVGQDSDFSDTQFQARYNSELANNLGNLVNRTLNMTNRFADAKIPTAGPDEEPETELKQLWASTQAEVTDLWTKFQFNTALERTMSFVTATNAYIEKRAPWKLGKSTEEADHVLLRTALATMAESLRLAATLLQPVTPGVTEKIYGVLGHTPGEVWSDELAWDGRLADRPVDKSLVLFPRIQAADKNSV